MSFSFGSRVAMTGHALHAAAERGDRTLAHFVGSERGNDGQAAAALFRAGRSARRLRRRRGTRGCSTDATTWTRRFIFVGFLLRPQRRAAL